MPKKTASHSLVGMTEGVACVVGEWHGCDWSGTGRRYLIVREPRERLASLYWYSQVHSGGAWGPGGVIGWCERLLQMANRRREQDFEWWATQSDYAERFQPDQVFRLEEGLQQILVAIGQPETPIQFRNVTQGKRIERRPFAETFRDVPKTTMDDICAWLCRDAGEWYL